MLIVHSSAGPLSRLLKFTKNWMYIYYRNIYVNVCVYLGVGCSCMTNFKQQDTLYKNGNQQQSGINRTAGMHAASFVVQ